MIRRIKALGIAVLSLFMETKISKRGKVLFHRFVKHNGLIVRVLNRFYDVRVNKQGGLRILLKRHNRG